MNDGGFIDMINSFFGGAVTTLIGAFTGRLGLSCNYACSYCNQAFQIADATVSRLADVEHFLIELDGWITGAPETIELWGGEPFLYWAKIKRLIPALAARFPSAGFSIITNGSLLDREKIDFIAAHDIAITISHDGPGQHLRGPDPFDDPYTRRWIETLLAERPQKTGFNAVLTREHHDFRALKEWFAEKVGPDIFVGLEGVVNVYDAATAIGTGRFEPAELNSLTRSIFEALVEDPNAFGLGERIDEFFASIQRRRPIEAIGQKCGMDRLKTPSSGALRSSSIPRKFACSASHCSWNCSIIKSTIGSAWTAWTIIATQSKAGHEWLRNRKAQLRITHPLHKSDQKIPHEQDRQGQEPQKINSSPRHQGQQDHGCGDQHIDDLQLGGLLAAQLYAGKLERRVLGLQEVKSTCLVLHRRADTRLGQVEPKRSCPPTTDQLKPSVLQCHTCAVGNPGGHPQALRRVGRQVDRAHLLFSPISVASYPSSS
ncbi:Radical SAM superfamily protein [Thalassovita litoralis]|uniref:Radical SAM superfamily protein n=1 Tax=Thalassovita litoralis TaxID=1010611 RepID=A0A521FV00_9RHOB|nr:radical SAM protein [Thalassovita litoralis]SMP00003.1 Radical SAM superfamily protein [Thalassovita litoralis]